MRTRPGEQGGGGRLSRAARLLLALRGTDATSADLAMLLEADVEVVRRTLRALEADGCVGERVAHGRDVLWRVPRDLYIGLDAEGVWVSGVVPRHGDATPETPVDDAGAPEAGTSAEPPGEEPRESRSRSVGFTRLEDMTLEHHVLGALEEGVVCPMERLAWKVDAPVPAVRRALETLAAERLVRWARGLGGVEGWCLRLRLQSEVREDGIRVWEGRMETMEEKVRRESAEEGRDASYLDRQRRGRGAGGGGDA